MDATAERWHEVYEDLRAEMVRLRTRLDAAEKVCEAASWLGECRADPTPESAEGELAEAVAAWRSLREEGS